MQDSTQHPVMNSLQQAAEGLLFPSETDAPLEPFFWPSENPSTPTPEALPTLAGMAVDMPVQTVKLDTFFRPTTTEEDWHNADEKAQVKRFQELLKAIKATLKDVKVFRVGDTKIDVYIVGMVDGGYVGLKTHVVET